MRSKLRALALAAVVAAGGSSHFASSAQAADGGWGFYSNGAPAQTQSSGRARNSGYPRPQPVYQAPAASPAAPAGYWHAYPQPVYQAPAAPAGYWHYHPQPVYQAPAPSPAAVAGYWYFVPERR